MSKKTWINILVLMLFENCFAQQSVWTLQNTGSNDDLKSVYFIDPNTGWIVGSSGSIFHTSNGGQEWSRQQSPSANDLSGVFFVDSSTGWAVGHPSTIFKTVDGGTTWAKMAEDSSQLGKYFRSVFFVDYYTGFITGNCNTLLRTTDCGRNWSSLFEPDNHTTLTSVYFRDSSTGWVTGDGAGSCFLLRTTNGGTNWTKTLISTSTEELNSVCFTDSDYGIAVGGRAFYSMQHIFQQGELFKTTDGGISWNEMENYRSFGGYYPIFNSVHFSDRNNGWIVSNDGFILSTTNGGDSWTAQSPAGQCTLHSTFFLDNNSGWVVGSGGTVLKTRIENINSVNDKDHGQLARTFGLSQNYPNPFNPSTIITFSLPTRSFVSLKVFDGLGREIGILVNKELVAGTYTVKWNASGMASGVYFYRLHAGTFTESKKLILLR